jgi:5-methylcytosine-specific restriction enzyme A
MKNRQQANKRGYDGRWFKARAAFLQRNPRCITCVALGQSDAAVVVDHVVPHRGDQTVFWNSSMWQPACEFHHRAIKSRLELMFDAGEIAETDLRLNSAAALKLARTYPKPIGVDADGWAT